MPKYEIEMLWDCSSCGTKKIGGTVDHCPNCGAAHDTKQDPWYRPGDTSYRARITDPSKIRMAKAGPNWTCGYCGGTQRNPDGSCRNCAGPRSESHGERASGRPEEDLTPPRRPSTLRQNAEPEWPPSRDSSGRKIAVVAVMTVVGIIGVLYLLFHQRPVDIEVTSVAWTHTVQVERYKQVAESGFDEDIPRDAQNVVNEGSRIHHYEQVLDHYRTIHYTEQVYDGQDCVDVPQTCYTTPTTCSDNGNGTMSCSGGDEVCSGGGQSCTSRYRDEPRTREEPVYRDEPRYEDHYCWTVWRWNPQRSPTHSGRTTQTTWPDAQEICLNCKVGPGEKEREAGRASSYKVSFLERDSGKTFDHEPGSESEFRSFPVGSKHSARYSIVGGLDFSTVTR